MKELTDAVNICSPEVPRLLMRFINKVSILVLLETHLLATFMDIPSKEYDRFKKTMGITRGRL